MYKANLAMLFFLFVWGCSSFASAAGPFDGKWYFDESFLAQYMPPEHKNKDEGAPMGSSAEKFLSNTYLLIDIASKKMEMVVFGEETETDSFQIVEQKPGVIRIKPFASSQVTVLTILDDGRLEMREESSGYSLYLFRRSK